MAIKVKHDGNVTSRIYASAAGGKGKRQAEDAIRLAQLQASAAGRSGGTGGGAHTSATAPTTHAPTSHAQLGSTGSFVSPQMSPETRMRLADDELTNKLIEMDNADAYRAAAQERQGEIDLSNSLERMNRGAEIDAERELTAQGRRDRAALVDEVVRAVRDGKYGKDEIPGLIESYKEAEDRIRLADSLREREPTEQERFDKSIVTDADGNRFYKNAKGDYVPLPNPTAEAQETEAKRQAEEQKKLEAERQKAEQKRAEERQKFVRDYVSKKAQNNDDLNLDAAIEEANAMFDKISGTDTPKPNAYENVELPQVKDGFTVKRFEDGQPYIVDDKTGKMVGQYMDGEWYVYWRDENGLDFDPVGAEHPAPWLNATPTPTGTQEEAIGQEMREAAARGDLHPLEMEAMGLLPDGFSVKERAQGVSVFDQDGKSLGAVMNDGRVAKWVRDKNGKIVGYDVVEKSEAPWLNSTPASATQPAPSPEASAPSGATQPATPVVGDPASFDQFKKRK